MDTSIFLAKLVGLYLLILGLLTLLRSRQIKALSKELSASKITLAVSAEISLLFGLVIAIDHPIWEMSWRGLITLFGYLMILRGIIRFGFPARVQKMVTKMTDRGYGITAFVMLIIGAYLTYCGFTQ